jgi:hypothetical protein
MPRLTPHGAPLVDVPVAGPVHMNDANRPAGHCRFSVNTIGGIVRPGSVYDSVLGTLATLGSTGMAAQGLHEYRTPDGRYFKIAVLGTTGTTVTVHVIRGSRVISSTALQINTTTATNARAMTWATIGNRVLFAGGPLQGTLGLIEFNDDGSVDVRPAGAYDRTVNPFSAGDAAGPYRLSVPPCYAVSAHQGFAVIIGESGVVYFSNLNDPEGWPLNYFFLLADGTGNDKTVAIASVAQGHLFVGQRSGIWDIEGSLADIATTTVARKTAAGFGPIAPASVQVFDNGQVMFLSERGPVLWASGDYIPASGLFSYFTDQIGALFSDERMDDLDVERYRPLRSHLAYAISRFSRREQTYELALGAIVDSGDAPEDRRLRLRYHVPSKTWTVHVHPPTAALLASHDAHDDEVLMRADRTGLVFFEGYGDVDQTLSGVAIANDAISARIQTPFADFTPERGRPRRLWMTLLRDWTSSVEVAVLPDRRSSQDEQTVTAAGETRDIAFSADGQTDGFTFGTSELESDQAATVRRGLPPLAAGRRVRFEFRTPDGATAGHRWGITGLQLELTGGGRS